MSAAMTGPAKLITAATPTRSFFIRIPFMRWHPSKQHGPNLVAWRRCRSFDRSQAGYGNSALLFRPTSIFGQSRTVLRVFLSNGVAPRFRALGKLKLFLGPPEGGSRPLLPGHFFQFGKRHVTGAGAHLGGIRHYAIEPPVDEEHRAFARLAIGPVRLWLREAQAT